MASQRLENLFDFLKDDPRDTFTLYSIAYEYKIGEAYKEAAGYFEQLKTVDPDYLGLYYHLGACQERLEQATEAEATYREGIQRSRKKGEFHTLSELQGALNRLLGLDFEDEV